MKRVVCQFSCGITSAVAVKLALTEFGADHEVHIINAFIKEEHQDNRRFLADCEAWYGRHITVLRNEKYGASAREVFRRERFFKNRNGAPCSRLLKREVLAAYHRPGDIMVLGYDASEADRMEELKDHVTHEIVCPLIDRGLSKGDCLEIVARAGILSPAMYRLGYGNANCIACVKGGEGYWNKIKRDFPNDAEEMMMIQEDIGEGAYIFRDRDTGVRYSIRDLPPGKGRHKEVAPSCGFFCFAAIGEIGGE